MSQNLQIIKFFQVYCKFLSIDLYTSGRPPINKVNGEKGGRNIILMYKFLEVFYSIYNREYEDTLIDENIELLDKAISEHIRVSPKINGLQKLLYCENINATSIQKNGILNIFNQENMYLFKEFYKIVKVFKKHLNQYPEVKAHFSRKEMQPVLGQGLIEFHNAMSHLTFVAREKKCDDSNIAKAMSHIYRGILDNIKSIIINLNLDDEQKELFIIVRALEFNSLGISVNIKNESGHESTKKEVLKKYIDILLDLLSGFPKNKVYKEKVLTKRELRAKVTNNRQKSNR